MGGSFNPSLRIRLRQRGFREGKYSLEHVSFSSSLEHLARGSPLGLILDLCFILIYFYFRLSIVGSAFCPSMSGI